MDVRRAHSALQGDAAAVTEHLLAAWTLVKDSGAPSLLIARRHLVALVLLRHLVDHFEQSQRRGAAAALTSDLDAHAFWLPPQVRALLAAPPARDLAGALNQALLVLCQLHPRLRGVFADIDFRDPRALGQEPQREATLQRLLRHLAALPLCEEDRPPQGPGVHAQALPTASGALLDAIAVDVGHGGSPPALRQLLVDLLAPRAGQRLCDPACGVGGWLAACAVRVARDLQRPLGLGTDPLDLALYGQELNSGTAALCQAHLLLCGISDARIARGDTLRAPRLLSRDAAVPRPGSARPELLRFDRVAAVPPPRLPGLCEVSVARDGHGRFCGDAALASDNRGAAAALAIGCSGGWAMALHALATLTPTGVAALVLPLGALYRQGREQALRMALLEQDLIDGVIAVPRGLLPQESGPAAVLLLRRERPAARRGRVLLARIDGDPQAGLAPQGAAQVVAAFHGYSGAGVHLVPVQELMSSGANLSPDRHLPLAAALGSARDAARGSAPFSEGVPLTAHAPAALLREARRLEAERDAVARELDRAAPRVTILLQDGEPPEDALLGAPPARSSLDP